MSSHVGEGEEISRARQIEDWKRKNCYRKVYLHCRECCSGGMMLGSMCEEAVLVERDGKNEKPANKHSDINTIQIDKPGNRYKSGN